jgi:hypothetical protein
MFGRKTDVVNPRETERETVKIDGTDYTIFGLHELLVKEREEKRLADSNNKLEKKAWESEKQIIEQKNKVQIELMKAELRAELQKAVVESDLKRVRAESMLEAYKEMDTKEDREELRKILTSAVSGLTEAAKSNPTINIQK